MKRNTADSFSHAPQMAPRRAVASSSAASTRCTMYWSVHQYQRPTMGGVSTMPSHGNSGSSSGFHMSNRSSPTASRSSPQPPISTSPKTVTAAEPPTRTNACSASV